MNESLRNLSVADLRAMSFEVKGPNQATIDGVLVKDLTVHLDGRGDVTELWSASWIKDGFVQAQHVYQSATDYGVIKCWHLHQIHTDQFSVTRGRLQVCLVDLRPDSPTRYHANSIILGAHRAKAIVIPPGIMHGWRALSQPEVLVVNCQSHVYDAQDELKFPWDCVLTEMWEPRNG